MTERIFDLTIAIAPKRIRDRHHQLGTDLDGMLRKAVGILDIEMQRDGRSIQ